MPAVATPARSLVARLGGWLSGADRRTAKAAAQVQAEQERAAALARAQAEAHERAEAAQRARGEAQARAQVEEAERKHAAQEARAARVAAGLLAVESSDLPLVQIITETGGKYYMKRADWLDAKTAGATNVRLCAWHGGAVAAGERPTLRVFNVARSELTPIQQTNVQYYQHEPNEHDPEQGRGLSL